MCACVFVQGCCSDVEAQQAGRSQTMSQPLQCELPTIPVQIGSHFLKGVSFNESAAENLKLKMVCSHVACGQPPTYVPQKKKHSSFIIVFLVHSRLSDERSRYVH